MSGLHGGHVFNQGKEWCNDNHDNHYFDLTTKPAVGNSLFSDLDRIMKTNGDDEEETTEE